MQLCKKQLKIRKKKKKTPWNGWDKFQRRLFFLIRLKGKQNLINREAWALEQFLPTKAEKKKGRLMSVSEQPHTEASPNLTTVNR